MFPIRWNFPFRKKNGALSTIGDEIESAGGSYTLPTASAETKGGVKIGSGLTMTGEVLSNDNPTPYSLPTASSEVLGGVKVGTGLTITEGVLSNDNPTPYSLPTASSESLGGVKVGTGLSIADGVLSNSNPTPTFTTLTGLVNTTTGTDLKISNDGDIYTISGKVVLENELSTSSRVQIGESSIPSDARIGSGWCPMLVTMSDDAVTKFTIATLTVYANGNIFINNNFADVGCKTLYVCCSYRKMSY